MNTLKLTIIVGLIIFALFGYQWFPSMISKILNNKFTLLLLFGTAIYIIMTDRILGSVLICILLYLLLIDSKIINTVISTKLDTIIKNPYMSHVEQTSESVVDNVSDAVDGIINKVTDFIKENKDVVEKFMIPRNGKNVFPYNGQMKELTLDDDNMSNL